MAQRAILIIANVFCGQVDLILWYLDKFKF